MSTAPRPMQISHWPRYLPLAMVALFFLACLGAEWIVAESVGRLCVLVAFGLASTGAWVFGRAELFKPNRSIDVWKAWIAALAASLLALIFGLLVAIFFGAWHPNDGLRTFQQPVHQWLLVKLPTVAIQQIALQLFIVPCIRTRLDRPTLVALVAASIFAALHLPNPILVGLTWVAGYLWIWHYLRFRQLVPLIVSHFILAIALEVFGGEYVLNMRVGTSCLELLPRTLQVDSDAISVLSHAINGRIDCVTQASDEIVVRGHADDLIHNRGVTAYCLFDSDHHQLIRITTGELLIDSSSERRHGFELQIPLRSIGTDASWELYAANPNGWYSRIGPLRAIEPLASAPKHRNIQLFPKRIDGRCEQLTEQVGCSQVSGWVIDVNDRTIPTRLGVYCDERNWVIPLAAKQFRYDIAEALGMPNAPQCGFDVMIREFNLNQARRIAFFAVDQHDIWHPLLLTPKVSERVAENWPHIDLQRYR